MWPLALHITLQALRYDPISVASPTKVMTLSMAGVPTLTLQGVVTTSKGPGNYKLGSVTGYCAHLRAWRRRASSSWPPFRRGVVFPSLRVIGRKQHMERFIHKQNMELFRKQLDAETNEARRNMLLRLLAQEEANGKRLEAKAKEITIGPSQHT